MSGDTE